MVALKFEKWIKQIMADPQLYAEAQKLVAKGLSLGQVVDAMGLDMTKSERAEWAAVLASMPTWQTDTVMNYVRAIFATGEKFSLSWGEGNHDVQMRQAANGEHWMHVYTPIPIFAGPEGIKAAVGSAL